MPQGIEVRDANGNVIVDLDSRLARYVTLVNTGTSNGSTTVASDTGGTLTPLVVGQPMEGQPALSVTGNQLSWSFGTLETSRRAAADVEVMVF